MSDEEVKLLDQEVAANADMVSTQSTEAAAAQQRKPKASSNKKSTDQEAELSSWFVQLMDEGEVIRDYMWEGLAYQLQTRMVSARCAQ